MTRAEINAAAREMRALCKANGVCVKCQRKDARPGRTQCQECADGWQAWMRSLPRARKKAARRLLLLRRAQRGECRYCGKPWRDGPTCDSCKAKRTLRQGKARGYVSQRPCGFCHQLGHYQRTCKVKKAVERKALLLEIASGRIAA